MHSPTRGALAQGRSWGGPPRSSQRQRQGTGIAVVGTDHLGDRLWRLATRTKLQAHFSSGAIAPQTPDLQGLLNPSSLPPGGLLSFRHSVGNRLQPRDSGPYGADISTEVRPATANRWSDLVTVFGQRGEDPSWCWCRLFLHPEQPKSSTSAGAPDNRDELYQEITRGRGTGAHRLCRRSSRRLDKSRTS